MNTLRNTLGALVAIVVFFTAIAATGPSDIEAMADMAMAHDDAITESRLAAMSLGENEHLAWKVCKGLHAERAMVYRLSGADEYVCRRSPGAL
jgi:hypothetical protein